VLLIADKRPDARGVAAVGNNRIGKQLRGQAHGNLDIRRRRHFPFAGHYPIANLKIEMRIAIKNGQNVV